MFSVAPEPILARRLGLSTHVSPLRFRLTKVAARFPSGDAACLEDWLLDVANARGARIVVRPHSPDTVLASPPPEAIRNEELVVAICQLQGADRPQLLRAAAQLVSRGAVVPRALIRLAIRERAGSVLGAMAREALCVAEHSVWRALADAFAAEPRPRDVVIHRTRLAEPVMAGGRCNAAGWKLVA